MSRIGLLIIAGVATLTLIGLAWLVLSFEAPEGTTTVTVPAPVTETPATETEADGDAVASEDDGPATSVLPRILVEPEPEPVAPAVAEPELLPPPTEVEVEVEEPPATEIAEVELPVLNESDPFVFEALRAMQNGAALVQLLADEQIVRKFVVFVENVSRSELPQTGLPYQAMATEMPVDNVDENLFVMNESAHARFDSVVDTFVAVDTEAALAIYRTLSPLFRQAYAELGLGNADFDETLRQAINNILATSHVEGPYQLVKPSVMYLYADAEVEELAAVHKQMVRLGPSNAQKLKAKLRDFMSLL